MAKEFEPLENAALFSRGLRRRTPLVWRLIEPYNPSP